MQPRTLDNAKSPRESTFAKRDVLLSKTYILAELEGYDALTRERVAEFCNCAIGTISYHFDKIEKLRDAVMRKAISHENLTILSRGLANGNKVALRAPVELKKQAAELFYK